MTCVFVSYRRNDSRASTGRIADRLRAHFGDTAIFQDIESIKLGVDFRTALSERLDQCDVFLAIIGDEWTAAGEDGKRRIDEPADPVRQEIAAALLREHVPVIPVLVGSSPIPAVEELPDDLKDLHYRNAIQIPSDDTFDAQIRRLIDSIESIVGTSPAPAAGAQQAVTAPPEKSGGSLKIIAGLAVAVLIAAFGAYTFRCELLNQCADVYFDFELESTRKMFYGDQEEFRLVARNKKGDELRELPKLDGRYEFAWNSSVDRYVSILEPGEGADPTSRLVVGNPQPGVEVGASVLSVVVTNVKTGATQRPAPVTITVFYDEALKERGLQLLQELADTPVPSAALAGEIITLITTERARIAPELLAKLEAEMAERIPVGDRLQAWTTRAGEMRAAGDPGAAAVEIAEQRIAALEAKTRLTDALKTYRSCQPGNPPTCSGEKSDYRLGDELYIGMHYQRESGSSLTLDIPGRDSRTLSIEQGSAFTYTMVGARPAGDDVAIRLYNSDGDLIGLTTVDIR